jgi:DNA modification methylase
MNTTTLPLERLIPYAGNPRKNDHAVDAVASAIKRFGFRVPVLAKSDGSLIDGHLRVKAAKRLGMAEVPVVLCDDLSEADIKALRISINRMAELAEWDAELLNVELEGLAAEGFTLDDVGFDAAALDALGGENPFEEKTDVDAEPQIDKAEELRVKWGVEPGQLWELGEHRLLCGDSTKAEDVERCLGGVVPLLMVTDPPYGVEYDGGVANAKKREKLTGDADTALFGAALMAAASVMPGGAWYVWHADRLAEPVYTAIRVCGWDVRALLIWNKLKPHYGAPMAHYCQKHEPCLYAVKGNAAFCGPSNECTVWDIEQPHRNEHHPTQKPIECMARPIRNHDSEFVYEPFSGSGTTIIACEQLGRKCRAIEISPAYVAVALQRWADATGKTPKLVA